MAYYLGLGEWQGVFAVPMSLIDKHLKLADEAQLKVILWTLRHSGELFSREDISAGTGISAKYIDEALEYWIDAGIIKMDGNNMVPAKENPKSAEIKTTVQLPINELQPKKETVVQKRMLRPDGVYIAQRMKECPELMHLLQEAELILGKTISPSMAAILVNAYDDYELPCEVIIMLLSYVKSIEKTTTNYIESLSKDWSEKGIKTLALAENKISQLNSRHIAWRKLSSTLGIPTRNPSQKEEDFAFRWFEEFKLSRELIIESYNRCVDNTGKLQYSYMNKILDKWQKNGIRSLKDVEDYEEKRKKDKPTKSTFDVNELDALDVFSLQEKK